MSLTLIIGPMKSGKSYDLISFFAPLRYSNTPYKLFQSARNVRDGQINSRNGVGIDAEKIKTLHDIIITNEKIIGIDEVHMFPASGVEKIHELLRSGIQVIVSGLDLDYQGKLFETVKCLFELGPNEVRYRRAVCDTCRSTNAIYSQVLQHNMPIVTGMPPVIPDDGTFTYTAACRDCFVRI